MSGERIIGPVDFPGGFTVLMAAYHKDDVPQFIRAVNSVYANDLQPNEFTLVVDGPVPELLSGAISELSGKFPLRVLWLQQNVGLSGALNAGLKTVRTEWVLRADADDINLTDRFSTQARLIQVHPDVDLMGGNILEVDEFDRPLAMRYTPQSHNEIVKFAAYRNPFNHMTVAYKSDLVNRIGGYPNIYLKEDYGLWASLICNGAQCRNSDALLVRARTGKSMYRRRGGIKYANAEISLQRHLVECGLKNPTSAVVHGLLRSSVFVAPAAIRELIYRRALRGRTGQPGQ